MKNAAILDRLAVSGSMLCVVHCLAVPLLLAVAPVLAAGFLSDEHFHQAMLAAIVPMSVAALFFVCRRHRDKAVIGLIGTGLVVLIVAGLFGHDLAGEAGEKALTVAGSVALSWGHLRNLRLSRAAPA